MGRDPWLRSQGESCSPEDSDLPRKVSSSPETWDKCQSSVYMDYHRRFWNNLLKTSNVLIFLSRFWHDMTIQERFWFASTFQASDSHSYEDPAVLQNFLDIYRSNPSFEMVTVKGSHHLHLNTPERVLPPLLNFIKRLENIDLIDWLRHWGSSSMTINRQCHEKLLSN